MSEKIRKLKEDASRLIAKGRVDEAADCYEKIVKADPRDLTARQKLAELYGRLGKVDRAVHVYQSVAGSYAADGLLLKAIAVCKIILQLDPRHTETQAILADLSTKRRGGNDVVEMPKAMSEALPSGKKSAASIRGTSANQIRGASTDELRSRAIDLDDAPAAPAALGVSASTSIEELGRVAASMLPLPTTTTTPSPQPAPAAPPPAARALPDDEAFDISFEDAEPVVVGAINAPAPTSSAPLLTAAFNAALPSFDELMASTPDVPSWRGQELTSADGPAIVGEPLSDSGAAIDDRIDDAIDNRIDDDVEDLIAAAVVPRYADPAAGQIVSSADEVGDLGFAPARNDDGIENAGDDDDVLDLDDSDIASAQIDVDRVPPIPLFSDLPRDAFVALTERMELRIASPGQRLIVESEPGVSMFVIIQGAVQVVRSDGNGNEVQLAQLGDGTFFGEMALLSSAPRTASVVVTEETMLFEISRELVDDMTAQYPSVGEVMKKFHRNRLITNLLKTSPVFAPFSTNDKKELIEKFKSRDVAAGTYLLTRQQPRDGLYVVLSGRCEVLDTVGAGGEEVAIAELREGDVFGEMSMLWNKETSASVRAVTTCTVLRLPRASFSEVIMTHPQILETLSALSEKRLKHNLDLKAAAIASDFLL